MTTVRTRSWLCSTVFFFLGGIHRANDVRPPLCFAFDELCKVVRAAAQRV